MHEDDLPLKNIPTETTISTENKDYDAGQTGEHDDQHSEHARLLSEQDDDDYDEEGGFENTNTASNYTCPSMLWRDRTIRYIMMGVMIGLGFFIFRITLALVAHQHGHHPRPAERLYHNGTEYFASAIILVSLDGFKPDYLNLNVTPHLNQLANDGIQADYMYPSFPSLTFPNHWTLVTGLHPESHGIVANDFYDPVLKQRFQHSDTSISTKPVWWQAADPIWKTCTHFNRLTASIMWPGSEAITPTYLYPFDSTKKPSEIVDLTLELVDMPYKKRPQFISVHISHADSVGHASGPDGEDIKTTVEMIDQAMGQLMDGLKQRHVDEHVHIVVVSDHGMARTDKYIYYDDILSAKSLSYLQHREGWPLLDLRPHDDAPADAVQHIYTELADYVKQHPKDAHYQVYLRKDVPAHYHYSNHSRIAPIITIPDVGYAFINHNTTDEASGITHQPKGVHGYDILHPDMLAVFMAKGPKINRWYPNTRRLAPFHNVEVYEFLTELLNIDANPNNGTLNGKLVVKQEL